jgi:hypothetical protein
MGEIWVPPVIRAKNRLALFCPDLSFEPLRIDLNKVLKMVFHAPVIIERLRIPGTGNGGRIR